MPPRFESKNKIRPFSETNVVTTRIRGVQAMVDVMNRTARLSNGRIVNVSHREMHIAGLANRHGDSPKHLSALIKENTGERVSPNMISSTLSILLKKLSGKK